MDNWKLNLFHCCCCCCCCYCWCCCCWQRFENIGCNWIYAIFACSSCKILTENCKDECKLQSEPTPPSIYLSPLPLPLFFAAPLFFPALLTLLPSHFGLYSQIVAFRNVKQFRFIRTISYCFISLWVLFFIVFYVVSFLKSVLNELKLIEFGFVAESVWDAVNSAGMCSRACLIVSVTSLFSFKSIWEGIYGHRRHQQHINIAVYTARS